MEVTQKYLESWVAQGLSTLFLDLFKTNAKSNDNCRLEFPGFANFDYIQGLDIFIFMTCLCITKLQWIHNVYKNTNNMI